MTEMPITLVGPDGGPGRRVSVPADVPAGRLVARFGVEAGVGPVRGVRVAGGGPLRPDISLRESGVTPGATLLIDGDRIPAATGSDGPSAGLAGSDRTASGRVPGAGGVAGDEHGGRGPALPGPDGPGAGVGVGAPPAGAPIGPSPVVRDPGPPSGGELGRQSVYFVPPDGVSKRWLPVVGVLGLAVGLLVGALALTGGGGGGGGSTPTPAQERTASAALAAWLAGAPGSGRSGPPLSAITALVARQADGGAVSATWLVTTPGAGHVFGLVVAVAGGGGHPRVAAMPGIGVFPLGSGTVPAGQLSGPGVGTPGPLAAWAGATFGAHARLLTAAGVALDGPVRVVSSGTLSGRRVLRVVVPLSSAAPGTPAAAAAAAAIHARGLAAQAIATVQADASAVGTANQAAAAAVNAAGAAQPPNPALAAAATAALAALTQSQATLTAAQKAYDATTSAATAAEAASRATGVTETVTGTYDVVVDRTGSVTAWVPAGDES